MNTDLSVLVTDAWRETFPDARVGVLVIEGVENPPAHAALEAHVRELEARLRTQFAGADRAALLALPSVQAYVSHYRAFGQNYHVLRQLESVALKGKPLASRDGLVLAMFAAEIESLLLTAGHDLDATGPALVLDRSNAGDRFIGIGGQELLVRPGDMLIRDGLGIISAVVYGPDQRTRLNEQTRRALFTTYAPSGIENAVLHRHLEQIAALARMICPAASVRLCTIQP